MTSTGWKMPSTVAQDKRKAVNNNLACYGFVDLKNITKEDTSSAYIPTSGGIDSTHASPVLYASNYGFKIPTKAKITKIEVCPIVQQATDPKRKKYGKSISKIKLLKLKTGTSTTDYGVGNSKLPSNTELPYKKWSTTDKYTSSGTLKEWGVSTLTPSMVNNSNFGCVFQCIGIISKAWVMPRVAQLKMRITYTTADVEINDKGEYTYKLVYNNNDTLDLAKPDDGVTISIQFTHNGEGGETPQVNIKSTDLLLGSNKLHSITLPTIKTKTTTQSTTYTQSFRVYPGTLTDYQSFTITINKKDTSIKWYVSNSNGTTSITDSEKAKYDSGTQRLIVRNCTFTDNTATNDGGAMFVRTDESRFIRQNNTYTGNTAKRGKNIKFNGEEYDS